MKKVVISVACLFLSTASWADSKGFVYGDAVNAVPNENMDSYGLGVTSGLGYAMGAGTTAYVSNSKFTTDVDGYNQKGSTAGLGGYVLLPFGKLKNAKEHYGVALEVNRTKSTDQRDIAPSPTEDTATKLGLTTTFGLPYGLIALRWEQFSTSVDGVDRVEDETAAAEQDYKYNYRLTRTTLGYRIPVTENLNLAMTYNPYSVEVKKYYLTQTYFNARGDVQDSTEYYNYVGASFQERFTTSASYLIPGSNRTKVNASARRVQSLNKTVDDFEFNRTGYNTYTVSSEIPHRTENLISRLGVSSSHRTTYMSRSVSTGMGYSFDSESNRGQKYYVDTGVSYLQASYKNQSTSPEFDSWAGTLSLETAF